MKKIKNTEFGEYVGRVKCVIKSLKLYQAAPPEEKRPIIRALYQLTEDCPFYIRDLLVTKAVQRTKAVPDVAIDVVAGLYKETIKDLVNNSVGRKK